MCRLPRYTPEGRRRGKNSLSTYGSKRPKKKIKNLINKTRSLVCCTYTYTLIHVIVFRVLSFFFFLNLAICFFYVFQCSNTYTHGSRVNGEKYRILFNLDISTHPLTNKYKYLIVFVMSVIEYMVYNRSYSSKPVKDCLYMYYNTFRHSELYDRYIM